MKKFRLLIYAILLFCVSTVTQRPLCIYEAETDMRTAAFEDYDHSGDIQSTDLHAYISANETAVNPPRPTSYTAVPRQSSNAKRQSCTGNGSCPIIKSGKLLDHKTIISSLNSMRKFPSGFTETTHHLISLGKLVI